MTTQQQPSEDSGSSPVSDLKFCTYCRTMQPANEFVKVEVGRGGKLKKNKCGRCHRNSKLPVEEREKVGKRMSEANREMASQTAKYYRSLRKD